MCILGSLSRVHSGKPEAKGHSHRPGFGNRIGQSCLSNARLHRKEEPPTAPKPPRLGSGPGPPMRAAAAR